MSSVVERGPVIRHSNRITHWKNTPMGELLNAELFAMILLGTSEQAKAADAEIARRCKEYRGSNGSAMSRSDERALAFSCPTCRAGASEHCFDTDELHGRRRSAT